MTSVRHGSAGRLVIVAGPPAAGKSTLAARLTGALDAVCLEPDAWMSALAIGLDDAAARERVEHLQRRLALTLLDRGLTVILDWGAFTREKRASLRADARGHGAAVELRWLDAPADELWRRIRARGDGPPVPSRDALARMLDGVQPPTTSELAEFDPPARGEAPPG